ncbi:hypothetical protein KSC_098270 [Ktedonobacter sp. SOSP1-52]|uniref:PadR family transcriptional regulator n=1 Tax=Ktedonobacter sp. SOSP1-52 TaxID=2778366 RepID=UPI0019150129|nr:PadR family transcriptional regulator [Ktedonobacter sp. SOSP1-52]GHO70935.1 hypothetical protein KSC_098270 [Ktedonobacter sp. SOSP1-52]
MYELLILAHLLYQPAHGYLIAKIINDMIGPYAKFSNGRLYPLLARLEENGLLVAEEQENEHGNRPYRSYRITDKGRERFRLLMLDTTSNPGEYQKVFQQKMPFLSFLAPSERLYLIDHYLNYCQAHILHLQNEREDLHQHSSGDASYGWSQSLRDDIFEGVDHLIAHWQLEYTWAQHLRERELARTQDATNLPEQTTRS